MGYDAEVPYPITTKHNKRKYNLGGEVHAAKGEINPKCHS